MADREILYRLGADTSDTVEATGRATRALDILERGLGDLAGALGRGTQAGAAFDRQQNSTAAALARAADWEQRLAAIRAAGQDRQRAQYQAGEQFVANLQRQADGVGKTRAELLAMQAAQLGVADRAAPLIARLKEGEKTATGFARSGKLTAMELQQVGFQLNDLAVQVASGQNPIIALVQQGSQLSGTFGGVRPALAALGSLLTPAIVGFGALAVGIGAVGLAYVAGERDDARFRDSLVLTGNAAGVTRGSFESMAATVQATSGITIGAARDITQQLVASGQVGSGALSAVAQAAATLARVSGQSADEVVKDFAGMASGAARWALEKNKAYNFLTAETYRYIKSLEAQGKTEEAMRVAATALDEALKGRTRQLGLMETAWEGVKNAASGAWNAMLNVGKPDNSGDQAQKLLANLALARERLAQAERRGTSEGGGPGEPGLARRRAIVESLEAQLESIRLQQRGEREAAGQSAATAKKNREDLLREQEGYQSAAAGLQRSGLALVQAQAEQARKDELVKLDRSYDEALIGLAEYVARREALEKQAIDARGAAIDKEIALEKARQPGSPEQVLQQQSRVNDLLARRIGLESERLDLSERARVNFDKEARAVNVGPADDFRRFENRDRAAEDSVERDRYLAAAGAARDLVELNRQLGTEVIRDDLERGQAQIAEEERVLRERLNLASRSAAEREQIEADVAEFIRLRNVQLTEQLKPEWQRQLDDWADTARLMRETHARLMDGFIQRGEEAWLEFNRTGKLSLASFGNLVRDELARLTYRQFIAPAVANIGKKIAEVIGIKLPGAADSGMAAAKAAEATATANTTVALTALQTTGLAPATGAFAQVTIAANAAAAALSQLAGGGAASGLLGSLGSIFSAEGGGFSLGGGGLGSGVDIGEGFDLSGFAFARGAAFQAGRVQQFARGQAFTNTIVTEPTPFRFARGQALGEMGEAGPEAIMPLTRMPGGKLGVAAMGGGGAAPNVTVNIIGAPSEPKSIQQRQTANGTQIDVLFEQFEARLGERIDNGVGLAKNVSGRFGVNGGATLQR